MTDNGTIMGPDGLTFTLTASAVERGFLGETAFISFNGAINLTVLHTKED